MFRESSRVLVWNCPQFMMKHGVVCLCVNMEGNGIIEMYGRGWAYLGQTQRQEIRSPLLPDLSKQSAAVWERWLSSFQVC